MPKILESNAIYEFFDQWKANSLLKDGSLLWPSESIWTLENLERLKAIFIDMPYEDSDATFMDKLKVQLEGQPPSIYKLFMELDCLYLLFPANRRMKSLQAIASLGGFPLPDTDRLQAILKPGLASTGQYYNQNCYWELRFLILFAMAVKLTDEPAAVLDSLTETSRIIDDICHHGVPRKVALSQGIKHLLFPDLVEPIASFQDKGKIIRYFQHLLSERYDASREDEQLLNIRKALESQNPGQTIGFYKEDWSGWNQKSKKVKPVNKSLAVQPVLMLEDDAEDQPLESLEDLALSIGYEVDIVQGWLDQLERKSQVILYGPPGTGKTFVADRLARYLQPEETKRGLVQFHPSYSYEDFIQGFRPNTIGGHLVFESKSGIFKDFCAEAAKTDEVYVFIIDEINRANLSSVFGELMYLLEYRDHHIKLPDGDPFSIPENIRIIGTMNTADRSIALMDHALRRRFAFIELAPNYDLIDHPEREKLKTILKEINQTINDPHYALGHSYFMNARELAPIWQGEIEPYLREYFIDQPDKVKDYTWARVSAQLDRELTASGYENG